MAQRPFLVPNYGQLTQIDIPGQMRADRALGLQRGQLAHARRMGQERNELAKAKFLADYNLAMQKLQQGSVPGGQQINLMSGQPRYFKNPNDPNAAPIEAFIDERSGIPYNRAGQQVPPNWKNVTSDVMTQQAERKLSRKIREKQQVNWEDNRADMREEAQTATKGLYQDLSVINSAIDNWQDVATGPGANVVAGFDKMKSFLGIDITPSSPALAQEYNQAFKNRIASKYFADQKGGLNEKEFTAIMDAAPDIHKTAVGNMMLLEVERSIADWKLRRNSFQRTLLSDNRVGPLMFNKKLDEWDRKNSKNIIPLGLKKQIRQEQAKAKKVSYADIFATAADEPVRQTAPGKYQMQDYESLGDELDQL